MKIESEKTIVNAPIEKVFNFLTDAQNIEQLLPKDEVKEFKATEKECSFKVQGGVIITLVQEKLEPHSAIKMKSGEKSPFPFDLTINLEGKEEQKTLGYILFDGEVNAFLQMMVKKPLTNLFNFMSNELQKVSL